MPETAEEMYARVVAMVGEEGRLPMPRVEDSEVFPWEGDLQVRVLRPPVGQESPRVGAPGGPPCPRCADPAAHAIWRNENWVVTSTRAPTGLPLVLFLESAVHMDFMDMDDELASEWGRLCNTLHRVMSYLPNIGNVHVCKWGDGSYHLHTWFIARPARLPQVRGSAAADWNEILPPVPEDVWRADLHEVARKLATHDGEPLV